MRHGFVKTAVVTPKIQVADPVYNEQSVERMLDKAWEEKAKVIVFPELCLTAYTCEDLFFQPVLLKQALKALEKLLLYTRDRDSVIFVGMPLEHDGSLYNVAVAIQNGRILGVIPKTNIPTYGEFYEGRHFRAGSAKPEQIELLGQQVMFGTKLLFVCENMPELRIGCEICEDLWVADSPGTAHVLAGATMLVNLSASNELVGKEEYRRMLVQSASARLICAYLYASAGEGESTQDLVFGGHDLIAENGTVLADSRSFAEQILFGDVDVDRICSQRRQSSTFTVNRDTGYCRISFSLKREDTLLKRVVTPFPFVPEMADMREKRCREILAIQIHGLKKRMEHTGTQNVVIGLSGGLDSTLALLVAVGAYDVLGLDREGILTVTMPCFGTTDRTYQNACRLAQTLGSTLMEIDIREAVEIHFRDIGQNPKQHDVTYENGQARERTQILMDLANKYNGLVVGTGDLSELALGWATYNGDHMSMYGVNVGVPKTLVKHLVKYCADICQNETLHEVLTQVLDTPVSPELLPPVGGQISQKTEELVGPYELHDFFLYHHLRNGFTPDKIRWLAIYAFRGIYDEETITKWLSVFYKRFFAQQFKRSCLPDGPKVGTVSLSPRGDWRMPSDACGKIWQEGLETEF